MWIRPKIPHPAQRRHFGPKDEPVIIPIHMKDGVILGKGLGNPDWNCSALTAQGGS